MRVKLHLAALLLVLGSGACRPRYSLDRSDDVGSTRATTIDRVPVRGSLVTVVQNDGARTRGELLAVDERYVWVLPPQEDPVSVPRVFVRAVAVAGHATASAEHVDALFQFARFPQGLPSDTPAAVPEPPRVVSSSPPTGPVPPPPGAPAVSPEPVGEVEPLGDVPPAPGADVPPPPSADAPPPPGGEAPPPPGGEAPAPPDPDPYAPVPAPAGETGAGLSPPPRGS